jgi:hypothetical protein
MGVSRATVASRLPAKPLKFLHAKAQRHKGAKMLSRDDLPLRAFVASRLCVIKSKLPAAQRPLTWHS